MRPNSESTKISALKSEPIDLWTTEETVPETLHEHWRAFIAPMLLIVFCWGFNFTVIKFAVGPIRPITFRATAGLIAAVLLFFFIRYRKNTFYVAREERGFLVLYALLTVTCYQVFSTYGIYWLPSGRASILGYTMPIWAVILNVFFLNERLTKQIVFALICGLSGMILLVIKELTRFAGSPSGVLLMIASAVVWALATVVFKRAQFKTPLPVLTFWSILLGALSLVGIAGITEYGQSDWPTASAFLAIGYNAVIVLIICQVAWFKVLKIAPANLSSLATLGVPVVGVICGFVFLGETPQWQDIVGLVLILTSLFIVLRPQPPGES